MPRSLGGLRVHVRVVREDAHLEGAGALHHFASDAAEAQHAQRLAAQFIAQEFLLFPLARLVEALAWEWSAPWRASSASVCSATETALPPGVFITRTPAGVAAGKIHVVHAHSGAADDAQFRSFRQNVARHLYGAANDQRIGDRPGAARIPSGFETTTFPAWLRAEGVLFRRRQRLSDQYLHDGLFLALNQ